MLLKINKNSTCTFTVVNSTLYIFNKGDDSMRKSNVQEIE